MTVRSARQLAGLTQASMAEQLGICRHTYLKYEGNPDTIPIGCARLIAKITGQHIDAIFFESDSTQSRNNPNIT